MNTSISALTRTVRGIRRATHHLIARLTRKASIKLTVTVSLPPFVKIAFDYKADIGAAANDNQPRRHPRHTA